MRKLKNEELGRKSIAAFKAAPKLPLTLILDNIRSLNNIGSVFRTADAFCIQEIILCGITATPPHKDIQKTALGATATVAWRYEKDTLTAVQALQKKGVEVWAVEQAEGAQRLNTFVPKPKTAYALVLGHEVKGVAQEVVNQAQGVLEIPQEGTKHSLNISVAAGIVLWDFFQKLKQA
jgi:23S rRNA (guanosine2251-2'-O)-methyltransferase